jgi:hypothetical protein
MPRATVAKLLGAKLITATAVVAVATGGVALAAATNALPDQAQGVAHHLLNAPSPDQHSSAAQESRQATEAKEAVEAQQPGAKPSAAPLATPSASLRGLCTAYQAGATSNDGKAISNPAFKTLVTAAGGADGVAAYCTKLAGAQGTHPTGQPSSDQPSGKPAAVPTAAPTPRPAGKPTALPTTGHPTGSPTTHPGHR